MATQTSFNPGSSGANYAHVIMGAEDDLFHLGAKDTQWKQKWRKYTAHQAAMIVQALQNSGLGAPMSAELIRNTDFLYTSYIVQTYPAIRPATEAGVNECSWVNCPAFYSIRDLTFKIGSQNIFQIDGLAMLMMTELLGQLDANADNIGYCKTRRNLINQSRFDRTLYAPMIGLPFQGRPDLALSVGAIAFHGVKVSLVSRPLNEMVVNYGGVITKKGLYALPRQISTDQPIQANAVHFSIASNCVWVQAEERLSLIHGYNETVFREVCKVGEFQIPASSTYHREVKPIEVKGPVAFVALTIRSQDDIKAGNWIKCCQDSGLDWVKEIMLITGSTPIEDGLPASFYRTGKIVEAFKHDIDRYTYVFSFETDALSRQPTGHRNLTNAEGVKISALYAPCS